MVNINDYLTPQEHVLIGSTVEPRYNQQPYTPIAIQLGVDEELAHAVRVGIESIETIGYNWEPKNAQPVSIQLAPLNERGETLYDPQALNPAYTLRPLPKLKLR
ncbi:MAG TPA: hypothetical protein VJK51_05695, partial [Candidatus Nanoarchaeia archaeon]|nr:hypothetical protein [Candidatus Nanoarchaeia archaeon]